MCIRDRADREHDGLADFATDRIAQGVFDEGLAEERIGGIAKETSFELALLECLLLVLACVVSEGDDEALVGEEFRGDLRAGVHNRRVDQVTVLDTVQQRIA